MDVPVVALEWSQLRETYVAPGDESARYGIDYLVSPAPVVSNLRLTFDFDPLVFREPVVVTDRCPTTFDASLVRGAAPSEYEEVLAATVVAASDTAGSRTGRIFVTTGTAAVAVRTEGIDAGDPSAGSWWFIFEPAAGTHRLVVSPAPLGRSSVDVPGIPEGQPGVLALVQTTVLQREEVNGTVYAPWGFARDWRRYAHAWFGALLSTPASGLVVLEPIVAPGDGTSQRAQQLDVGVEVTSADLRVIATVPPDASSGSISIECGLSITLVPLTFTTFHVDHGSDMIDVAPGESRSFSHDCADGDVWQLDVTSQSLNGRTGALLIMGQPEVRS